MKRNQRRELFVVTNNNEHFKPDEEDEIKSLHSLLNTVENDIQFCIAHEILDLANYKIIKQQRRIKKMANQKEIEPFVFLYNKN